MTNKELMECIAAEEAGKKIECNDFICTDNGEWEAKNHEGWNTGRYIYRIAPEPPKREGKWVRKEIRKDRGIYVCHARLDTGLETDCLAIDALQHIPGFGGIEYQDPRNPNGNKCVGMTPVYFDSDGEDWNRADASDMDGLRPGTPVAAWFLEDEKP